MNENQHQDLLIHQLTQDDPEHLQSSLSNALAETSKVLTKRLREIIDQINKDEIGTKSCKSAILLRYFRELRQIQPTSNTKTTSALANMSSTSISAVFGQKILTNPLHTVVTQAVVEETREIFRKALRLLEQTKIVPGRCIWDGDPPLPIQPMPQTFRFLRVVVESMISYGYDIWSPFAVRILKLEMYFFVETACDYFTVNSTISHEISSKDAADSATEISQDQEKGPEKISDVGRHEKLVQLTFDVFYLSRTFDAPELEAKWQRLRSNVAEAACLSKTPALKRIDKSTSDYWKRTYLYFGLLASH